MAQSESSCSPYLPHRFIQTILDLISVGGDEYFASQRRPSPVSVAHFEWCVTGICTRTRSQVTGILKILKPTESPGSHVEDEYAKNKQNSHAIETERRDDKAWYVEIVLACA